MHLTKISDSAPLGKISISRKRTSRDLYSGYDMDIIEEWSLSISEAESIAAQIQRQLPEAKKAYNATLQTEITRLRSELEKLENAARY